MGYSKYKKLKVVTKKFHLEAENVQLFEDIQPIDTKIYTNLSEILGVWHTIIRFYVEKI